MCRWHQAAQLREAVLGFSAGVPPYGQILSSQPHSRDKGEARTQSEEDGDASRDGPEGVALARQLAEGVREH